MGQFFVADDKFAIENRNLPARIGYCSDSYGGAFSHCSAQLYLGGEITPQHHFAKLAEGLNVVGLMKSMRESIARRLSLLRPCSCERQRG
jgi:hypothetical protein